MATITIRNLSDATVQRLKDAAKNNGRSMEQEVRRLLQNKYGDRSEIIAAIRKGWERHTPPTAEEVDRWIKLGRE